MVGLKVPIIPVTLTTEPDDNPTVTALQLMGAVPMPNQFCAVPPVTLYAAVDDGILKDDIKLVVKRQPAEHMLQTAGHWEGTTYQYRPEPLLEPKPVTVDTPLVLCIETLADTSDGGAGGPGGGVGGMGGGGNAHVQEFDWPPSDIHSVP